VKVIRVEAVVRSGTRLGSDVAGGVTDVVGAVPTRRDDGNDDARSDKGASRRSSRSA